MRGKLDHDPVLINNCDLIGIFDRLISKTGDRYELKLDLET